MKIKLIFPPPSHVVSELYSPYPLSIAALTGFLKGFNLNVKQDDIAMKVCYRDSGLPNSLSDNLDLNLLNNFSYVVDYLKNKIKSPAIEIIAKEFFKGIDYRQCELIGFSIVSKYFLLPTLIMAKKIKEDTHAKIVLGGKLIDSLNREILLNFEFIDYLIRGEGEFPLLNLIKWLENGKMNIENIPGLIYRKNNNIFINEKWQGDINNNGIPYFDWNLIAYYKEFFKRKCGQSEILLPYEISKGCTNKCFFCSAFSQLKIKKVSKVISELKFLSKEYKIRWFSFVDNAINHSNSYLEDFCDKIIKNRLDIEWISFAKPQNLHINLLKKMRSAGCQALIYGLESGSQSVLNRLGKPFNVKEMSSVLKNAYKVGILNITSFILNYLYETEKEFNETIKFIENNSRYIISAVAGPYVLLNDSQIHLNPSRYGIEIIRNKNSKFSDMLNNFNILEFNEVNGLKWTEKSKEGKRREKVFRGKCDELGIRQGVRPEELLLIMQNKC